MIDRTAVDRQPDRDVHGRVEGHELDRDMALVMVLGDDQIEAILGLDIDLNAQGLGVWLEKTG